MNADELMQAIQARIAKADQSQAPIVEAPAAKQSVVDLLVARSKPEITEAPAAQKDEKKSTSSLRKASPAQIGCLYFEGLRWASLNASLKTVVWIDESGRIWSDEDVRMFLPLWIARKNMPDTVRVQLIQNFVLPFCRKLLTELCGVIYEDVDYLFSNLYWIEAERLLWWFRENSGGVPRYYEFTQQMEKLKKEKLK